MKKILALTLAVVLVLGMSTVALASKAVDLGAIGGDLFLYNTTDDEMESISVGGEAVPSGSTLYIPLVTRMDTNDGVRSIRATTVSDLSNYKLKTAVTEGKGVISTVRFTIKKDYEGSNAAHIAIETKPNTTGAPIDVAFTLTVTPDNGATVEEIGEYCEYDLNFTVAAAGKATTPSAPAKEPVTPAEDAIVVGDGATTEATLLVPSQTAPTAAAKPQVNPNTGAPSFAALTLVTVLAAAGALTLRK